MARLTAVILTVLLLGCGTDAGPIIRDLFPLNRATDVDTGIQPRVEVGVGASIDADAGRVVLYDVTAGGKGRVGGVVVIEGQALIYQPSAPLQSGRDYALVLESGSVTGDALDQVDESESPREPVSWPFRLEFRTGSRPRVRGAYLEPGEPPRVVVRFSQPMNPLTTGKQIQVEDLGGVVVPASTPVWLDTQSVEIGLTQALDPVSVFSLTVNREAAATDGILLDGDDDGVPGEASDGFSAQFTGSQAVIRSRLR